MVTLFLTALAIIGITGIGVYFWQKSTREASARVLPPLPDTRGLFEERAMSREVQDRLKAVASAEAKSAMLERAKRGERSALDDANATRDSDLYDRVVSELVRQADTEPKLLSLASHVSQNDLPANLALAKAMIASWMNSPNRNATAKALHFAALSDDASLYRETIEQALRLWREGKLVDISTQQLRALFDGEFWILSARTRSSGAGFVLKQTLADARRELEAAASATHNTSS